MKSRAHSTAREEFVPNDHAAEGVRRRPRRRIAPCIQPTASARVIVLAPALQAMEGDPPRPSSAPHDYAALLSASAQAVAWRALLRADDLRILAQRLDCRILFRPHVSLETWLDWFEIPSHVKLMPYSTPEELRAPLPPASVIVTDAKIGAPAADGTPAAVIYMCPPVCSAGGLGHQAASVMGNLDSPVCESAEETVNALERVLKRPPGRVDEDPISAIAFHDDQTSHLLHQTLVGASSQPVSPNLNKLVEAAEQAFDAGEWGLAARRWEQVLSLPQAQCPAHASARLEIARRKLG